MSRPRPARAVSPPRALLFALLASALGVGGAPGLARATPREPAPSAHPDPRSGSRAEAREAGASDVERPSTRLGAPPGAAQALVPEPNPGADGGAGGQRPAPGWFFLPGLSVGASASLVGAAPARWMFTLGGEASAAYLWGTTWAGVYAEGAWSTPGAGGRLGAGAEVGWALWGVELGWVAQLGPRGAGPPVRHGVRLGALATVGAAASYLRWVHIPAQGSQSPSNPGAENLVEVGVLLKWPVALGEQR